MSWANDWLSLYDAIFHIQRTPPFNSSMLNISSEVRNDVVVEFWVGKFQKLRNLFQKVINSVLYLMTMIRQFSVAYGPLNFGKLSQWLPQVKLNIPRLPRNQWDVCSNEHELLHLVKFSDNQLKSINFRAFLKDFFEISGFFKGSI